MIFFITLVPELLLVYVQNKQDFQGAFVKREIEIFYLSLKTNVSQNRLIKVF